MKAIDDYVTQADLKSQTLIIKGLRKFWPNMKIIGEESIEYNGPIEYNIEQLQPDLFQAESFKKGKNMQEIDNELEIQDCIVWIDPLDGTLGYVTNELHEVTTLIGLQFKSRPTIGIISQPYFFKNQTDYQFSPQIYFGHAQQDQIYNISGQHIEELMQNKMINNKPQNVQINQQIKNGITCLTNKYKINQSIKDQLSSLNPDQIVYKYGSGSMIMELLLNRNIDYIANLSKAASRWDTCAGEALIVNQGGFLSGLDGNLYDYANFTTEKNTQGIFATLQKEYINQIISKTQHFKFD